MRTIKFRAKITGMDLWIYGLPYSVYSENVIDSIQDLVNKKIEYIKTDTLGQFTGLHDDNNNEIYEGDILSNGINCSGAVYYKNGMFLVDMIYKEYPPLSKDKEEHTFRLITVASVSKIIGNIYENLELL